MYYRADVYIDAVRKNSFIANSIEVLKVKAQHFIENEKVNFFTAFKLCCMCFASADQRSGKVQD